MKIYCVRHGETNYNRLGLCNDDPAREVHLTGTGIHQAETVAEQLRSLPIERIFISELPRTRETADIINRHHQVPVEVHPTLNDIRSGFESRPVEEYFAATGHDRLHVRINGGESLLDYKARVLGFLEWLRDRPEESILVVAHEETLRIFSSYIEGLSDEDMQMLRFGNCVSYAFEVE
jgi:broad specificity phosphatase PhoE